MIEVWKDIVGYEGKYQVSNIGRVKSLNYKRTGKEKILKNRVDNDGYMCVNLHKDGKLKSFLVHRLVAMAFVDGYEEGLVVNHIDECKDNNVWTNLEWVTQQDNINYGTRTERQSEKMKGKNGRKVQCIETEEVFESLTKAGEFIGVTRQAIYKSIKKGRSCKGLHWQYVE